MEDKLASIVIELRDFTTVERANLLVEAIDDRIGSEEEVIEIRLEE